VTGAAVLGIGLSGESRTAARAAGVPVVPTAVEPTTVPVAPSRADPTPTPVARYTPSSPVHLVIPAVDLDLPLLGLTPEDGVIDPPLLTAGYWIEPYAAPVAAPGEAGNTLYIAAHSAGRRDDGFDPLLTRDHEGSALQAGDVVEVRTPQGTASYTVDHTRRYGKNELPGASDVWEAVPGRLVLITCFQRADGRHSTENLVVFAESS
jgi:sortase (surface protein transpeptidase)